MSLAILDGAEHQLSFLPPLLDTATQAVQYIANGRYGGMTYISAGQTFGWVIPSAQTDAEVWIGLAAIHNATLNNSVDRFILTLFGDGSTTTHLSLYVDSTGKLYLYRGTSAGTLLGSSAAGVVTAGVWYYLELHAVIDNTVGEYEVRVDGVNVLSGSGADTQNGGTAPVTIFRVNRASTDVSYYDDVYCVTGDGVGVSGFQNEISIEGIRPNGNGNYSQLVGQDGDSTNNYQNVDELPFSSVDYNGSSTPGNKDTYTYGNLTATSGTILGSVLHYAAYKNAAGFIKGRGLFRIGGTDYARADTPILSGTVRKFSDVMEDSPATSSAWTISEVNGLEAGFEVRSA